MTKAVGRARRQGAAILLHLLVVCIALQSFAGLAFAAHPVSDAMAVNGAHGSHLAESATPEPHAHHVAHAHHLAAGADAPNTPVDLPDATTDACTTMLCCFGEPALAEMKPASRVADPLSHRLADLGPPSPALIFPIKRPPRLG